MLHKTLIKNLRDWENYLQFDMKLSSVPDLWTVPVFPCIIVREKEAREWIYIYPSDFNG